MTLQTQRSTLTTISGTPVSELGLAGYPGQSERCIELAANGGVNLFFFYGPAHRSVIRGLEPIVSTTRDEVLIAGGSGSRNARGLQQVRRRYVAALGTGVLDIFVLEYLNPSDDPSATFGDEGPLETLRGWRDEGLIRYVGVSTHDVDLALRCVRDGRVDVLMLRCNMAHRRLASAVFPRAARARLPVVAFTATRWRTLLAGHPAWNGPTPTAPDCYRYCLAQPAVTVVLSAATTPGQVRENLQVLGAPRLPARERRQWEAYGDLVHGGGTGAFDTTWP